eukprot:SAG31_NODE_3487_length_4209_cov_3.729684_3_plen_71_part_00
MFAADAASLLGIDGDKRLFVERVFAYAEHSIVLFAVTPAEDGAPFCAMPCDGIAGMDLGPIAGHRASNMR